MQKRTKSILEELDNLLIHRDHAHLFESRATNVIQSAINLINALREHYDADTALELERRLINSIRSQDSSKFTRGVKKINETITSKK